MGEQVCRFFTNQGGFFMSKDSKQEQEKEEKEEKEDSKSLSPQKEEEKEDSKSLSPQKEVKGRPGSVDYRKAE